MNEASNPPLENYFGHYPSDQFAADLFTGHWSSIFPGDFGVDTKGFAWLFDDERIRWAADKLGGFERKSFCELGPLEGGHSYMLEKLGAGRVVAVEANSKAYLRCLIAKEICKLKNVEFLLGDFMLYLEKVETPFDCTLASGILYHQTDPVRMIEAICSSSRSAYLWTVYYEEEKIRKNEIVAKKFGPVIRREIGGKGVNLYTYRYGEALDWEGFSGGGEHFSYWLDEEGITHLFEVNGFAVVARRHEENQNGPAISLAFKKE